MMTLDAGALLIVRNGRAVELQRITPHDRYLALVGCGVRESFAAAVAAKIITMKVRI